MNIQTQLTSQQDIENIFNANDAGKYGIFLQKYSTLLSDFITGKTSPNSFMSDIKPIHVLKITVTFSRDDKVFYIFYNNFNGFITDDKYKIIMSNRDFWDNKKWNNTVCTDPDYRPYCREIYDYFHNLLKADYNKIFTLLDTSKVLRLVDDLIVSCVSADYKCPFNMFEKSGNMFGFGWYNNNTPENLKLYHQGAIEQYYKFIVKDMDVVIYDEYINSIKGDINPEDYKIYDIYQPIWQRVKSRNPVNHWITMFIIELYFSLENSSSEDTPEE